MDRDAQVRMAAFDPAVLPEIPLSIRTSHEGPYEDSFTNDNLVLYRYRGRDPNHWQNASLRRAMELAKPMVYFHGVVPAKYLTCWPVYVVGDDPANLTFTVSVDDATLLATIPDERQPIIETQIRRAYVTSAVRRRLHQRAFRERVISAYREQCAMCRLRHERLLDAAHIIADADARGEPRVDNGLALCKIHHAAFDQHILGVRPTYEIVVREDVLREIDGPMLKYGLQELHGGRIVLPTRHALQPSRELLEARFEAFRRAS